MSLDVYLRLPEVMTEGSGIFVRENGSVREITRAEWDEKFPEREPILVESEHDYVYSANITSNLIEMASKAGLYQALWEPDENGYQYAHQIVGFLKAGLDNLKAKPEFFKMFNPENGWGDYDGLVSFVGAYLQACEEYPDALVSAT